MLQRISPIMLMAFAMILAISVSACVCDTTPTAGASLNEATAVFAGRYIGSEYRKGIKNQFMEIQAEMDGKKASYEIMVYKFEVSISWKGPDSHEVVLMSDDARLPDGSVVVSDCGLGFVVGREYLIYAYGSGDDFGTGVCTRTKRLSRAKDDIRTLNRLKKPIKMPKR